MKQVYLPLLAMAAALAIAPAALADTTYSGAGLAGLYYQGNTGDAQYVPGSPAYAELYTADAGTAYTADSPAVFVQGPLGNLSGFSGSYDLLSSSGGNGNPPYWILWVDDPSEFYDIAIIGMGGPTINGFSEIHVWDPNNIAGSYWGDTLSDLDAFTYPTSTLTFGDMTVDWAGIEIGDWAISDNIGASADIRSISVPTVPEPSSLLLLLLQGAGLAGLAGVLRRRRRSR